MLWIVFVYFMVVWLWLGTVLEKRKKSSPFIIAFVWALLLTTPVIWIMSAISNSSNDSQKLVNTVPNKTVVNPTNAPIMLEPPPTKVKPKEAEEITLTPKQARDFAHNLYKKIEEDEQFIGDAVELGEYETLIKYDGDWFKYANTPHSYNDSTSTSEMGYSYWPNSEQLAPYTDCNIAFINFKILVGTRARQFREDSSETRKRVRENYKRYQESKAACKKRVDMTYEKAWKAEEAEWIYAEEATPSELSSGIKE